MTTRIESAEKPDSHVSSPQELACELNNILSFPQEQKLLRVSGIFRDKKRDKIYGGFTYDALLDMTTQQSLTLIMPVKIKESLRDGRAYVFRGYLQRKISGGEMMNIEVAFRVSGVEDLDLPSFEEALIRRSDVFHAKCSRGFKRVESIILDRLRAGHAVRITLVHGIDAVVDKDVEAGFAGLPSCYEVTWKGVRLRDGLAVITALKELDAEGHSDIIGIIRGGGDLEIFNDVHVAHTAAELNTPFIAAIGHVVDRHLCAQVADKDFGTPTALGVFLEKQVEQAENEFARERGLSKRSRALEAKEAELSSKSAELSQRESKLVEQLTKERQPAQSDQTVIHQQPEPHPNRRSKLVYLTAGVLLGVVIGILIVRGVNWSGASPVTEANQNQLLQPTPTMSSTPTASPTGDTRRKRKATSGQ
jgi:hypothetical protein